MNKVYDLISLVEQKELVARDVFLLVIRAPEIAYSALPGQFVQIGYEGQNSLLRRPFSIAGTCGESILLLIKMRGPFTRNIYKMNIDNIKIIGPLGSSFPEPPTRDLALIAGGIGIAPLLFAAQYYGDNKSVQLYYGINKQHDDCSERFLARLSGVSSQVVCEKEDGLITDFIRSRINLQEERTYFICGPGKMMVKTAEILYNVPYSYYSLESMMGCGLGICLGCTLPMKGGNKRVCIDGPVFEGSEILWKEYNPC